MKILLIIKESFQNCPVFQKLQAHRIIVKINIFIRQFLLKKMDFLDYDSIQQIFSAQQPVPMIQHCYQKTDGTKLTLSIYPVKNKAYGSGQCHTIWLFEKNYSKAGK